MQFACLAFALFMVVGQLHATPLRSTLEVIPQRTLDTTTGAPQRNRYGRSSNPSDQDQPFVTRLNSKRLQVQPYTSLVNSGKSTAKPSKKVLTNMDLEEPTLTDNQGGSPSSPQVSEENGTFLQVASDEGNDAEQGKDIFGTDTFVDDPTVNSDSTRNRASTSLDTEASEHVELGNQGNEKDVKEEVELNDETQLGAEIEGEEEQGETELKSTSILTESGADMDSLYRYDETSDEVTVNAEYFDYMTRLTRLAALYYETYGVNFWNDLELESTNTGEKTMKAQAKSAQGTRFVGTRQGMGPSEAQEVEDGEENFADDDDQDQTQGDEEQDQTQGDEEQDQTQEDEDQDQTQEDEEQDQTQEDEEQDQTQEDEEQDQTQEGDDQDQTQEGDDQDQYQEDDDQDQYQEDDDQDQN